MGHRFVTPPRARRGRFLPQVESLERRACPAVTATFAAGVLSVVGDDGPNDVRLADAGDGSIELTGDGQSFSFTGVDETLIQTLAGDDRVSYAPKSYQVITAGRDVKLHIDVGSGDDRVSVRDDSAGPRRVNQFIVTFTFQTTIDLGTGDDYVHAQIQHYDDVDLDVLAADGGDGVALGMLLPAVQKVREAAARINLDLGGAGDLVNVSTVNYDDVEAILAAPAALPDTHEVENIQFTFQKIDWGINSDERFAARLNVQADLGDAADRVAIVSAGFLDVTTELSTGGGNDSAVIRHRMFAIVDRTNLLNESVNLGAGNDVFLAEDHNVLDARLVVDAGAGDDLVNINAQAAPPRYWVFGTELPQLQLNGLLGPGSDTLLIVTRGFRRIATDIDTGPAGDGQDRILAIHISADPGSALRRRNQVTTLSSDIDRLKLLAIGFESVEVRVEQTRQVTLIQDL